jgi:hypothetical protein
LFGAFFGRTERLADQKIENIHSLLKIPSGSGLRLELEPSFALNFPRKSMRIRAFVAPSSSIHALLTRQQTPSTIFLCPGFAVRPMDNDDA